MNLNDFFLEAIKNKAHHDKDWVIRAFSATMEAPDAWLQDKRPYRLVKTPLGHSFVNPLNTDELIAIEDSQPEANQPLFLAKTLLTVPKGYYKYWPEGGITTAGNLFFNSTCIWTTVGHKIPYVNKATSQGKIEENYFSKMQDDPADGSEGDPTVIYVRDWIAYSRAIAYMSEFSQLFVWSLSHNSIVPLKPVKELKAKLLEQYKDQLDDPIVQTKIIKEIEALDSSIQANNPDKIFMSSKKSKQARRKLFGIFGAEQGLDSSVTPKLVTASLDEGFSPDDIVEVMNVSRAGSHSRGAETMLGGIEYKWANRVTSGYEISDNDCGTALGYTYTVASKDIANTAGRYMFTKAGLHLIKDEQEAASLIGSTIKVRSPNKCAAGPSIKWCKYCLGEKLSANRDALGLAVGGYSGGFLQLFLDSMHSKAPVLVRMNVRSLMS